jgi:hypothetical protein
MTVRPDAYILTGMGAIINPENVIPGVDLKELETQMINGGLISEKAAVPNIEDRFEQDLRENARRFGIELNGDDEEVASTPISPRRSPRQPTPRPAVASSPRYRSPFAREEVRSPAPASPYRTSEAERRRAISEVVGRSNEYQSGATSKNISAALDMERMEDEKMSMIAEIDNLYQTLKMEGIDVSRIIIPEYTATYEEVDRVLRILRYKNDHNRYRTIAEEIMLFGAHLLGDIFNGERQIFGQRPYLKGWHNNVAVKLSRVQHETSKIVNTIVQDYNIGSGTRLMMELVPNAIMYSKNHAVQEGQQNIFDDMEMK